MFGPAPQEHMARSAMIESVRPAVTLGRVTSGAVGGAVGGFLFGALMLGNFAISQQINGTGMLPEMQQFLGTTEPVAVWGVHLATSVLLGVAFSLIVAPRSYRSSVLWALGYILVAGFIGSQVLLRTLTGHPVVFDPGAAFALIGHLLYGLGLGVVYVAFHNLEVREALHGTSEKWNAWALRESREFHEEP